MMKIIIRHFCAILILFFVSCSGSSQKKQHAVSSEKIKSPYTIETFKSADGWGYEIKKEEQIKIRQPYIPGIEGRAPFDSEADARLVGEYVLKQVERGAMLPTVSKKDLDSLQIIY